MNIYYDRRERNPKLALDYIHGERYHLWSRLRRQFNFFNRWWQTRIMNNHSTILIDAQLGKGPV
jgi:hypothetical protein